MRIKKRLLFAIMLLMLSYFMVYYSPRYRLFQNNVYICSIICTTSFIVSMVSLKIHKKLAWAIILLLLFVRSSPAGAQQTEDNTDEGLYFQSYMVDKDHRTGLDLTPDKPLTLSGGFTLAFDFKLRPERDRYGYIFRIIGDQKTNIDLISNYESHNTIVLVAGNNSLLNFPVDEIQNEGDGKWIKAELAVNMDNNTLAFTINGIRKSANFDIRGLRKFNIRFGGYFNNFAITDVAPLILKNIRLSDNKQRLLRYWKLDKHSNNYVLDECKAAKATVTNPVWTINYRAEWIKRASITVHGKFPQITFDKDRKKFFVVKNNLVYILDMTNNTSDTLQAIAGIPFNVEINQLIYDKTTDELIMYDFEKNYIAKFNFVTREWDNSNNDLPLKHFMHHNKYFDEKTRTIYTFGGYGFHQYSALLQSFSETEQKWNRFDLSEYIHPRYLAAMDVWQDSLLLCFGGYGNISGRQHESSHNYFDLYTINFNTRHVRKLWELENVSNYFTNSNSLIINKQNRTFYTLSYPNNAFKTQIYLHEYSLDKPIFRQLGNPIPFIFNDVESYCNLFIPADSSALFSVTSYMEDNDSKIDIYSISYPPLDMTDILQPENKTNLVQQLLLYAVTPLIIAILLWLTVKYIIKSIRARRKKLISANKRAVSGKNGALYPAINLLNAFEVSDIQGDNISYLFTPTLIQLFLLIYFKTLRNGDGVTTGELQKTVWPDKDYESARNSRNVYLNKLRQILNTIGYMQIQKKNDYWILSYDIDKIHFDYERILRNIDIIGKQSEIDKELLEATLKLAKRGKLLPFLEMEWLDNYKTDYVNTMIDFLTKLTLHPDIKNDLPLLLNIADIILVQDSMEEAGIILKCRILFKIGKKQQALQCFNKYAEEYFDMLNTKPELTFEKIIK